MTTDDSKAKAAQHNGYLRGLEMGKAVIEDAWERQAYLMERKQREHQIAQNVFSPDIGAAYLRGFTDGLQRYPVEAHLADAEQQAAEEKITEWIETLRPLGEAARADGVETARALIAAAKAHDRFKLHALKSELIKTAEKHRGIQRREFNHGYQLELNDAARKLAREHSIELNDARKMLFSLGVLEQP